MKHLPALAHGLVEQVAARSVGLMCLPKLRYRVAELTGILRGTGAKMKADIQDRQVVFRGALKATVPFAEMGAEARGTLLVLTYKEHTIELAAGSKAAKFASAIVRG